MSLDSLFSLPIQEVQYDASSSFEELAKTKSVLETNLSMLFDHLQQNKSDMDTPLLTADGFPRADIDVLQVRMARSKIHVFRNDLKKVLELIDAKLVERLSINNSVQNLQLHENPEQYTATSTIPFAVITDVIEQSPAFRAGILVNDKIIEIGSINVSNHNSLRNLPGLIQRNEDVSVIQYIIKKSMY